MCFDSSEKRLILGLFVAIMARFEYYNDNLPGVLRHYGTLLSYSLFSFFYSQGH